MDQDNVLKKWLRRNWPLAVTGTVLALGVGVLLMRSTEYSSAPAAEAAVVAVPGEAVIVPGRATVITPGSNRGAEAALVSDAGVVN